MNVIFLILLFIFNVFLAVLVFVLLLCGLSLVAASGGFSLVAVADPHYGGISVAERWLEGTQALVAAHVGSVVVAHWLWSRGQ